MAIGILLISAPLRGFLARSLADDVRLVYRYGQFDLPSEALADGKIVYYSDDPGPEPVFRSPDGDIPGTYTTYDTLLTQASYLDAGDIEYDGYADLVSSSYYDGYIAILHQNVITHTLELVALWDVTSGGSTNGVRDVSIRDMNRDCRNDIVVFDVLNGLIVMFLQTDEYGVFQRTQFITGRMYSRGGADDLNNDGLADLLWTEGRYAYAACQLPSGGGFTGQQIFTGSLPPTRLLDQPAAGDVSGDDLADLVAADGYANDLLIWNTPNWQLSVFDAPNNRSENVVLGDLDGDGILDMAVPGSGTNQVAVTWGGAYTTTMLTGVGNMDDVAIGDVDDDDGLELIATDKGSYHLVVWNFEGRNGEAQILSANVIPGQVIAADLNGDGLTDVAYGIAGHTSPPHAPVTVHYQTGGGEVMPRYPACIVPTRLYLPVVKR